MLYIIKLLCPTYKALDANAAEMDYYQTIKFSRFTSTAVDVTVKLQHLKPNPMEPKLKL